MEGGGQGREGDEREGGEARGPHHPRPGAR
jgi:hypothetical protein